MCIRDRVRHRQEIPGAHYLGFRSYGGRAQELVASDREIYTQGAVVILDSHWPRSFTYHN